MGNCYFTWHVNEVIIVIIIIFIIIIIIIIIYYYYYYMSMSAWLCKDLKFISPLSVHVILSEISVVVSFAGIHCCSIREASSGFVYFSEEKQRQKSNGVFLVV